MTTIAIINGPNLNLLGQREPHIYGSINLSDIENDLKKKFSAKCSLIFFQSNHEGELIDYLQGQKGLDGMVINPGALTHTSIALRDCLLAKDVPTVEVHISNVHKREEFRKKSYFSDICLGTITGLGVMGYELAVLALLGHGKKA